MNHTSHADATPAHASFPEESPRRRHSAPKIIGIIVGVLVGLLVIAYVAGGIFFTGHFMPNTTLGTHDISLKTPSDVQATLDGALNDYAVAVTGQGFTLKLSAKDAGVSLDGDRIAQAALSNTNPWLWPLEITKQHDETDSLTASSAGSGLGSAVQAAVDEFNAAATPPTDAAVAFDEQADAFAVQKESTGTALDADAVAKAIATGIDSLQPTVKLTADVLQQPAVRSTDPKLQSAAEAANQFVKADMQLMMGGDVAAEVNPALVSSWVHFDEELTPSLDEGALDAWLDELEAACDTVGTERTYTRPDGKQVTVSGGPYGWLTDGEALRTLVKDGVANGTTGAVDIPCQTTGTAYNGAGAQDWGARYCDIDLSEQYVRFYDEAGALIWESACVTGTPNGVHNTPPGVYWLNQKASPSVLKGTNLDGSKYESTVRYWMPFVGNVIGMHDADWQYAFGGARYQQGFGSHGCVNLPVGAAADLFGIIQGGDVVVCHW